MTMDTQLALIALACSLLALAGLLVVAGLRSDRRLARAEARQLARAIEEERRHVCGDACLYASDRSRYYNADGTPWGQQDSAALVLWSQPYNGDLDSLRAAVADAEHALDHAVDEVSRMSDLMCPRCKRKNEKGDES